MARDPKTGETHANGCGCYRCMNERAFTFVRTQKSLKKSDWHRRMREAKQIAGQRPPAPPQS